MRPPAPTRAFWKNVEHCKHCKQPRPSFIMKTKSMCIACFRGKETSRQRKYREKVESASKREERRAKDRLRHEPGPIKRARDTYGKIFKQNPGAIQAPVQEFYPIYLFAEKLASENPENRYIIIHDIPIRGREDVCGLHHPKNLKVKRSKKAFYPKDPT